MNGPKRAAGHLFVAVRLLNSIRASEKANWTRASGSKARLDEHPDRKGRVRVPGLQPEQISGPCRPGTLTRLPCQTSSRARYTDASPPRRRRAPAGSVRRTLGRHPSLLDAGDLIEYESGRVAHLRERRSFRSRLVVCSRSRRLAATPIVNASHAPASSFSSGSNSFSLKKTRHVASAVRLLPSTNG